MPVKHGQGDLFICDVADAALKDLIPQMEHPFYSLSKKPDTVIRRYEHNGNWLQIIPSVKGLATIYDIDPANCRRLPIPAEDWKTRTSAAPSAKFWRAERRLSRNGHAGCVRI